MSADIGKRDALNSARACATRGNSGRCAVATTRTQRTESVGRFPPGPLAVVRLDQIPKLIRGVVVAHDEFVRARGRAPPDAPSFCSAGVQRSALQALPYVVEAPLPSRVWVVWVRTGSSPPFRRMISLVPSCSTALARKGGWSLYRSSGIWSGPYRDI
jgi:hypothetical protein